MEDIKRRELLTDFSKHVPRILHRQLITEQAQRYIQNPTEFNPYQHACALTPSIQRFHGSILFVDISGFTVLSQKLDVESLKNYINGYFSNIIEIVEKWGGDVIKFAGDALYVVWQTNTGRSGASGENDKAGGTSRPAKSMRSMSMMPTFINQEFRQNATEATKKAVNCGLEICEVCGNYPVYMEGKSNPGTDRGAGMFSSIVSSITSKIISRSLASDSQQPIAHLDVHCGVSVGLMAGLDVGYEDRWEYFLVGDALGDVARAEGQAEKGDVVISGAAHELYHVAAHAARVTLINEVEDNGDDQEDAPFEAEFEVLSCGCAVLTGNCFKLKGSVSSSNGMAPNSTQGQNRKTQQQARAKSPTYADLKKENNKLYEGFASEVKSALMLISPMLKREYATYVLQLAQDNDENDATNGESSDAIIEKVKQLDKLLPTFIHSKVRRHLAQWLEQSMVDHLARHVHDVAREGYTISTTTQLEPFRLLLESFLASLDKKGLGLPIDIGRFKDTVRKPFSNRALGGQQHSLSSVSVGEMDDASELDEHFDGRMTVKDASKSIQGKTFYQSAVDAEMRNVTVMFIKIDAFDLSLLIDASQSRDSRKGNQRFDTAFGFLERTENEQMADKLIIDKLQCCLEALNRAIYSHGGHLRQFIVDDKGTVCIASFGLRGAVNDDNAANAMDAANLIIRDLDKQHLHASIGITTGKAYCGLVGSIRRHEYAIMGPSVNLSARLMSKAGPGAILCDQETKNSDRAHAFRHRGEIVAKGYTQPVSTYSPLFGDSMDMDLHRNAFDDSTYPYMHGDNSLADGDESVISGRSNSEPGRGKQRSSALRFSIAVDAPQMHDIRSKSLKELASRERLLNMIDSEFFFTDEITGGRALDNAMNANGVDKSGKFAGFRTLRGRESEIERILKFLFEENGSDGFLMTNYEAPSRMVVVLGSGGAGKTALFSAIGQKLFTTAKTDAGCNVVVLSNRMSQLIASARQNPFRPILIELVRLLKKAFEVRSPQTKDSPTASGQAHRQHGQQQLQQSVRKVRSHKRMLIKEDSIREYNLVIDTLFEQLRSELSPLKVILTDLMGITSPAAAVAPDGATAGNESSTVVQTQKMEQFKTLLVEVLNFYAAYTKKVLLIIL
jgi:class 3 adenylate cyclase